MKQIITTLLTLIFFMLTGGQAMAEDESRLCKDAFWKAKPTAADVKAEIDRGELDKHCRSGHTPLHIAAGKGSPETIVMQTEHIDVNSASHFHGFTPLHFASGFGPSENVSALLELGADVNLPSSTELGVSNQQGFTPLHYAAGAGKVQNMKLLLEAGANIETSTNNVGHTTTPLLGAAHRKQANSIAFLIKSGADIEAVDDKGRTALFIAAARNEPTPIYVLLDAGANLEARNNEGRTPLQNAVQNIEQHKGTKRAAPVSVDILLDAGADPFATDKDGKTPFDYARTNKDWLKYLSTYKRLKDASGE